MAWKLKDNIPPEPASVTDLIDGDLDEVTVLEIEGKGLKCLPNDLGRLRQLRYLYAWHNDIRAFPDSFSDLSLLRALNVNGNPNLRSLPQGLRYCHELTNLHFGVTAVEQLPIGVEGLPIRSLSLNRWLEYMPFWPVVDLTLWDMVDKDVAQALRHFTQVTSLGLHGSGMSALSESHFSKSLNNLTIFNHLLGVMPDLRNYLHLSNLTLWNCDIESIPKWIGSFSRLKKLDLSNNDITTLPRQLADLSDDLDLDLTGNPLISPLDDLAEQGTPALFAYLRSLPDDREPEIAPDPTEAAEAAPPPQIAPLAARVEGERLVPMPAPAPMEADQAELQAMHAETLDWARQTLTRTGNHPLLTQMVKRCVTLLGDHVQALQVLPLAFANDRLRQVLEDTAVSGDDSLSGEQRGMCNGLVGNIKMLLNWTKEWKDYKLKTRDDNYDSQAMEQVRQALASLGQYLEPQKQAVEASLPPAIADLGEAARPGQPPEMVHGAVDGLNNMLSPLARHGLLKLTDKDKDKIRETVVQTGTNWVLGVGGSLAVVAATFILSHSPELMALAQALPLDYGWLRQVIAALRGLIFG